MKTLVRAFVLSLVVTGAVASTQIAPRHDASSVLSTRSSAMPTPMCPPDDPNACGIGYFGGH